MSELAGTFSDEAVAGDGAPSRIGSPLAIVIGALALTALLYWPTSLEIAELWQDTDRRLYTHGWLVLAVTVWLIWRDRTQLASIRVTPPTAGWCLVAIGSIGWLVGFNAGLLAMTTLAMPLLALTAIWATAGVGVARRVAFAVLYLYFALPVWELLNPLLQSLTTFVNLWLAQLVGIPVAMEENFIHIPAGSFEIAGGCSGLHFLIVALAIAALQGEIDRDDLRSRALLLGIAAALALMTNWLRVFIIIVAGHLTEMQHFLVKVDHYYFGWFLFVFALGFYLYVSSRVPRAARTAPSKAQAVEQPARGRPMIAAVLSAAALALGPTWLFAGVAKIEPTGQAVAANTGRAGRARACTCLIGAQYSRMRTRSFSPLTTTRPWAMWRCIVPLTIRSTRARSSVAISTPCLVRSTRRRNPIRGRLRRAEGTFTLSEQIAAGTNGSRPVDLVTFYHRWQARPHGILESAGLRSSLAVAIPRGKRAGHGSRMPTRL